MVSIKKRGREHSAKFHKLLSEKLKPLVERLSFKTRLSGRVRLLNRWGKRNPKKLTVYYALFAVVLLSINCLGFFSPPKEQPKDPLQLNRITDSNPFNGMNIIHRNTESIQNSLHEYADANLKVAQRLDSLCNLRDKTRADSVEILKLYKKINTNPSNNTP